MAIVYTPTNWSEASVAAAAATIQSLMRDALVAHSSGAWTLEQEFDSASSTVHWVVVKCATAVSGVGVDYRVVIGRVASTGAVYMGVGEGYDTTTKVLSKFAPTHSGATAAIASDGSYAGTFTLATVLPTAAALQPAGLLATPATTGKLGMFVDTDNTKIAFAGDCVYLGGFTSLITAAITDPPAIAADPLSSTLLATRGITRHPVAAAQSAGAATTACFNVIGLFNTTWLNPAIAAVASDLAGMQCAYGAVDRHRTLTGTAASEYLVLMASAFSSATPDPAVVGILRGKYKGVRIARHPTGIVYGDTVLIDARKHVFVKSGASNVLGFSTAYALYLDTGAA